MAESKLPLWRKIRRRAYWLLLLVLLNLASLLPIIAGRRLGVGLARLAHRVRPRERTQALNNIALVFPDFNTHEKKRLLAESVDALGANFFDILVGGKLANNPEFVREEADSVPGMNSLAAELAALLDMGKGVLILTGHMGAWELSGATVMRLWDKEFSADLDLSVVTGTVHNPAVNRLIQDRRKALGVKILPREKGVRPLLAALNRGGVVAVLLDQKTTVQNLPVPFFGFDVPTPSGFARMALARGCPVLPVAMAREGKRHVISYLPALDPGDFLGANGETGQAQQINFLAACNRQLETFILRNPQQWVWFHNRWAMQPACDGEQQNNSKESLH